MKTVLMLARAFPPFFPVGHSIRVVKFIKYLRESDWLPVVLTIDDQRQYETSRKTGSETLLSEIEPPVKIYRTTAGEPSLKFVLKEEEFGRQNTPMAIVARILSKARHWAIWNLLVPEPMITWLPFALRAGQEIVKQEKIDVIFATCPPHSVVLIGACLKLLTGKPLVLDYRDDWIDTPWYLLKPAIRRWIERRLERWAVNTADKVILVTDWSRRAFMNRYPTQPIDKFETISNGYDFVDFAELNSISAAPRGSRFTIVHAGSLTDTKSWARSPATLFQAIHEILQRQPELAENLNVIFAGDFPSAHRTLAEEMGLSGVIKGVGHLPHTEVLRLLKSADLLLAINYEGFETLIPGKIYEYWALGGPQILLLSCPGAAVDFVEQYKLGYTVDPSDVAGIQQAIMTAYDRHKTAPPLRMSTAGVEAYDRKVLTGQLARVLSAALAGQRRA